MMGLMAQGIGVANSNEKTATKCLIQNMDFANRSSEIHGITGPS